MKAKIITSIAVILLTGLLPSCQKKSTVVGADCNTSAASELYVDPNGDDNNSGHENQPLRTIAAAQQKVRNWRNCIQEDINVYLRGGVYPLTQALEFNEQDSGSGGFKVVYQAYPGEKPTISGGEEIKNWVSVGGGIYKTSVGSERFRQLYVNGERATRARTPNEGSFFRLHHWDDSAKSLFLRNSDVGSLNLANAELVVQRLWNHNRIRVLKAIAQGENTSIIGFDPERSRAFELSHPARWKDQAYHLENKIEFLDAPGEWYLKEDTGELFYKPRQGENINQVQAIAPRLETLLKIEGKKGNKVKNLQFQGIAFRNTTWNMPSDEGYVGIQAGIAFSKNPTPAGIFIKHAQNIRFERNLLKNMGGMGVILANGTHNIELTGNVVTDIADNGIAVGIPLDNHGDPAEQVTDNVIRNNYVSRVGQDYFGSVGIFAGFTSGTKIENNEVTDMPYTGISVGWGWTDADTNLKNNIIRYNRIHNVMNLLEDGGGIYTLSKQPGTVISDNYIYDIKPSPWVPNLHQIAGIYLDQGSSYISVKNNTIANVPTPMKVQKDVQPYATNNALVNNETAIPAVQNNSGLQPNYQAIKQGF